MQFHTTSTVLLFPLARAESPTEEGENHKAVQNSQDGQQCPLIDRSSIHIWSWCAMR